MKITVLILASAALLCVRAHAQLVPIQDRIAELCTVSSTDLVGQRLARKCRAQVRARLEGRQPLAAVPSRTARAVQAEPRRPR
jgi:hypothetical protein